MNEKKGKENQEKKGGSKLSGLSENLRWRERHARP